MSEQLELGIERRPRVALADAEQQGSVTVKKRPRVRMLAGLTEYEEEAALGYSWWHKAWSQVPWESGWYDIHLLGTGEYYRIWFDLPNQSWVLPTGVFRNEDIKGTIEWRGLGKPWRKRVVLQ